jgi:gamma-glutamyl hercynylcysteine S-oxide synthase
MPSETAAPPGATGDVLDALSDTRSRTLALVAHLDDDALERVHSPLMSPLVWDLGHIAAFEDLWLAHRGGGLPLLRPDLAEVYDAFETPRAHRGDLPYLHRAEALAYLAAVRERVAELPLDPLLHELVLRHEQQHTETMLQTMELAHLPAPPHAPPAATSTSGLSGLELVDVAAGPCTIGAPADGFAYDNERPRHALELPGFRIGRAPVTNGAFQEFVAAGGYTRPEWWSREAWAWKEQYDITHPAGWSDAGPPTHEWRMDRCEPLDPDKPVVHVSWFEADAFARAHGARLPTELEWEKAATWDQQTETAHPQPWGEQPVGETTANVDQRAFGTVPVGAHPDGASPAGCLGMIGDVWEWTAGGFDGYPGFRAHPYREYSEVFFGGDYRVLRGGSWATRARVATPTFRNWDHPQRRQIFAGLRIAKDA